MTNGQINCFLKVVEEGSFAKAAAALFISQPAISKSISKMEEELGFDLLERRVGALQPPPQEEHFMTSSKPALKTIMLLLRKFKAPSPS